MTVTEKEKVILKILDILTGIVPRGLTKKELKEYANHGLFEEAMEYLDNKGYIIPPGWEHMEVERFFITKTGQDYRERIEKRLNDEINLKITNKPKNNKIGIITIILLILINWDTLWNSINERIEEISSFIASILDSITNFINTLDPFLRLILLGLVFWYIFIRKK